MIRSGSSSRHFILGSGFQETIQLLGQSLAESLRSHNFLVGLIVELIQADVGGKILGYVHHCRSEAGSVNESRALTHRYAVLERCSSEIRVYQRGDHSDLGQTQPGGHKLGPVLQQQSHHVALFVAMAMEDVGHAIGMLIQLSKGPLLGLADDG